MKSKLNLDYSYLAKYPSTQEAIKAYLSDTNQKIMFLDKTGLVVSESWVEGSEYFVVPKNTKLGDKL